MSEVQKFFEDVAQTLGITKYPSPLKNPDRTFKGFAVKYFYKYLHGVEVSQPVYEFAWDEEGNPTQVEAGQLRFSHSSTTYFKFYVCKVCTEPQKHPLDMPFCWLAPFYNPNSYFQKVPALLLHPGVIPNFVETQELTSQAVFVAKNINFTPLNSSDFQAMLSFAVISSDAKENEDGGLSSPISTISGILFSVNQYAGCSSDDFEIDERFELEVLTAYGLLTIITTRKEVLTEISKIKEKDQDMWIQATGYLLLDCATADYQVTKPADELVILRLMYSAAIYQAFKLLAPVLSPSVKALETNIGFARGREEVLNLLRRSFHYSKIRSVSFCQFLSRKNEAAIQDTDLAVAGVKEDGRPLFFVSFNVENSRVVSLTVDSNVNDYEFATFLNLEQALDPYAESASLRVISQDYPVDLDFLNYRGFKENLPNVEMHSKRPNVLLELLTKSDTKETFSVKCANLSRKKILIATSHALDLVLHKIYKCEELSAFEITKYDPVKKEEAEVVAIYPWLKANALDAVLRSFYPWSFALPFEGEITFNQPGWKYPLSALDVSYAVDVSQCTIGTTQKIEVFAIGININKIEQEPLHVSEGPLYDIALQDFLKENPGKTQLDFPHVTISMNEMHFLDSTEAASFYDFVSPVKSSEKLSFFGEEIIKLGIEISIFEEGEAIPIFLYFKPSHFGNIGSVEKGDLIEGKFLLVSRILK